MSERSPNERTPNREAAHETRRKFLEKTGATLAAASAASVATVATAGATPFVRDVPRRRFGRHGETVSALGLCGRHLGFAANVDEATAIVHEAIDGGITVFNNAWEFNDQRSEEWMGEALKGRRDRVFLSTQVCTHGRDGALGLQMLEESLKRLGTDRLDLWMIHAIAYDNDPDLAFRQGGIVEAMVKAREQGKVRYIGFSGSKDPLLHVKMLEGDVLFDAVEMPLNPFDAQFRSFQLAILTETRRRGIAAFGMKSFNGDGRPLSSADVKITPEEALRYAMSLPGVTTTIAGMESLDVLRQNLAIAQNFLPMTAHEIGELEGRVAPLAADGHYELYKTSLAFDHIVTRAAHDMTLAGVRP